MDTHRPTGAPLRAHLLAGLLLALLLSACKTDLHTKRTEGEANDMVAVLLQRGIEAEKRSSDGGKTWNVAVDEADVVGALALLRANGLPQDKYASLGDMFKDEGLISTPTAERVRFIYGTSQELSNTLSRIDGVVVAKVHIVLPNNDPMATTVKPSSASVFVKYRPDADVPALTAAIKNLVARSVEGLSYENVAVTLVAGSLLPPVPPSTGGPVWGWIVCGFALLAMLAGGTAFAVWRWRPQWIPPAIAQRLPRSAAASEPAEADVPLSTSERAA